MASRQRAPSVSERLDFQGVPHGSEAQLASNEQRQRKPSRAAPRLSVRGVLGAELGQPAAVSDRDESAALRAWDDRRKAQRFAVRRARDRAGPGPSGTPSATRRASQSIGCAGQLLGAAGLADLTDLDVLDHETMLESVRARFAADEIYTAVGDILISVNPYQMLPGYYGPSVMRAYHGAAEASYADAPPHCYKVAEAALMSLVGAGIGGEAGGNQSVLISGESGAGKTEASKLVLGYLVERTADPNAPPANTRARRGSTGARSPSVGRSPSELCSSDIEARVINSNPVLESFGNAKTVRNNNSSRFGKYFEVQFAPRDSASEGLLDAEGVPIKGAEAYGIVGARIQQYLLEKSRVCFQAKGERSFHFFYQLSEGCDDATRARLQLPDVRMARFCSAGGCTEVEGVDDAAEFKVVMDSLRVIGLTEGEIDDILSVVAAIVHLGNIDFAGGDGAGEMCEMGDSEASAVGSSAAARLLGCEEVWLKRALRVRTMQPRPGGSLITIPLKADAAEETRDALAKELYTGVFHWLVDRINETISFSGGKSTSGTSGSPGNVRTLGVLDIFGFEIFETNSLEQCCINLANEKLHQQFIHDVFRMERAYYEREGVDVPEVEVEDNADVLALFEERPMGLLSLLQEECRIPRGTDQTLLEKLNSFLSAQPCFHPDRLHADRLFGVAHFAGDVTYDVTGFLDKNRDTLQRDLLDLIEGSGTPFVAGLLKRRRAAVATGKGRAKGGTHATVTETFKTQLTELYAALAATRKSYIRTFKPNDTKTAACWDGGLMMSQMRYSGVLECVRVRRSGFDVRRDYSVFVQAFIYFAYPLAAPALLPDECDLTELQVRSLAIFNRAEVKPEHFRLGKTKVFLKDPSVLRHIEAMFQRRIGARCVFIQRWWRGYLARREFRRQMRLMVRLQARCRAFIARRKYLRAVRALTRMQAQSRMKRQRKKFVKIRALVVRAQARVRGTLGRAAALRRLQRLILAQCVARRWKLRHDFRRLRRACVYIQRRWRQDEPSRKFAAAVMAVCERRAKVVAAVRRHALRRRAKVAAAVAVQRRVRGAAGRRRAARIAAAREAARAEAARLKAAREAVEARAEAMRRAVEERVAAEAQAVKAREEAETAKREAAAAALARERAAVAHSLDALRRAMSLYGSNRAEAARLAGDTDQAQAIPPRLRGAVALAGAAGAPAGAHARALAAYVAQIESDVRGARPLFARVARAQRGEDEALTSAVRSRRLCVAVLSEARAHAAALEDTAAQLEAASHFSGHIVGSKDGLPPPPILPPSLAVIDPAFDAVFEASGVNPLKLLDADGRGGEERAADDLIASLKLPPYVALPHGFAAMLGEKEAERNLQLVAELKVYFILWHDKVDKRGELSGAEAELAALHAKAEELRPLVALSRRLSAAAARSEERLAATRAAARSWRRRAAALCREARDQSRRVGAIVAKVSPADVGDSDSSEVLQAVAMIGEGSSPLPLSDGIASPPSAVVAES